MILGAVFGAVFGNQMGPLAQLSKIIIQLIQTFATPLLFFAIFEAVLSGQFKGKGVASMLTISAIDAVFAIAIGFTISNVFKPGEHMLGVVGTPLSQEKKWDWNKGLSGYIPESVLGPFVTNSVPALIVLAVVLGLAFRSLEREGIREESTFFNQLRGWAQLAVRLNIRIIEWIVRLVPFAVFAAVAKVVGEHGTLLLRGLAAYLIATIGGMAIQIMVVYQLWIKVVARRGLIPFWREAREPAVYSFGVNSSLATLPLTLRALDRLRISPSSARLSACVGTNLNNDGILLYEVVAALFVAQANGVSLSLWQQFGVALVSVVATIGVAGIPEAGIISLFLVLNTLGLPAESLPILLTVDWIVARCRSITNVVSDMTVAIGIEHFTHPLKGPSDAN